MHNKILVVDDHELICELITKYLEEYGFLCDQANTYEDAKKLLETECYDLITIDWQLGRGRVGMDLLPFVDGMTKVILISGMPEWDLRRAVQEHEKIDDYLPKVFKGEDLVMKVRGLLDVY